MEPRERDDPRSLGDYRILARLGAGGMAVVYLGRSRGGRAVAVKVMHTGLARRPELRDRFRHEVAAATAAGGLHSPPVVGADPDAQVPWMATEFLPSVSLREAIERFGPLPAFSSLRLAARLAEALAAIHEAGIVHLDVKPANVLLTADGPKLIDFGIAAWARPAEPAGSWGFMSPEQVAETEVGPPSDVYSLASTLDYALGKSTSDNALRTLIADCRQPDPSARPTAAALAERLARELACDDQHPDAAWLPLPLMAAIDAQGSEADNPPVPAPGPPGRRRLLLGLAVAAAGGVATFLISLTKDEPRPETNASREGTDATPQDSAPSASPSQSPSH
ncbi:serine/threonine-protein kinase, partial [Streptomyces sp. URMC 129]|uniref:serine/threonine-protein kinase n=1 Tax=Streptomyces sp. URMC 129 TaxID=3423407 RepID=UPI003F1AD003